MGFKSGMKRGFFSGLNVKRWVGMDHIKENGRTIGKLFKTVMKNGPKETTHPESFKEAMHRYNMTEKDLKARMKTAKKIITFSLVVSAAVLLYLFYLIAHHRIIPSFVCFMMIFLLLAYGFREHFNLYQMRQRRLGCSFKEYFNSLLKGSK